MKYEDVTPVSLRPVGAWQVELTTPQENRLLITSPSMPIEEVVGLVRVHHPNRDFTVRQIWAGEFVIDSVEHSYSADGRKVTQSLEVTL